jgi:hypothetical protein
MFSFLATDARPAAWRNRNGRMKGNCRMRLPVAAKMTLPPLRLAGCLPRSRTRSLRLAKWWLFYRPGVFYDIRLQETAVIHLHQLGRLLGKRHGIGVEYGRISDEIYSQSIGFRANSNYRLSLGVQLGFRYRIAPADYPAVRRDISGPPVELPLIVVLICLLLGWWVVPPSTADHSLQMLGIPGTLHLDPSQGLLDLVQVVRR